mmetsp:Transcript_5357/g.10500  ORF Transcript_5357/g.10500 Transcript_5357/m.10500 type:complete len:83 (+) Transcript_5357:785-1033(+)
MHTHPASWQGRTGATEKQFEIDEIDSVDDNSNVEYNDGDRDDDVYGSVGGHGSHGGYASTHYCDESPEVGHLKASAVAQGHY